MIELSKDDSRHIKAAMESGDQLFKLKSARQRGGTQYRLTKPFSDSINQLTIAGDARRLYVDKGNTERRLQFAVIDSNNDAFGFFVWLDEARIALIDKNGVRWQRTF